MENKKKKITEILELVNLISGLYNKPNFKVREFELVLFLYINPNVGHNYCSKNLKHNSGSAISRYSINLKNAGLVVRKELDKGIISLSLSKETSLILDKYFHSISQKPSDLLKQASFLREDINENNLSVPMLKAFLSIALLDKKNIINIISMTKEHRATISRATRGFKKIDYLKEDSVENITTQKFEDLLKRLLKQL